MAESANQLAFPIFVCTTAFVYWLYEKYLAYLTRVEVNFVMTNGDCRCDSSRRNPYCQSQFCSSNLLAKIIKKINNAEKEIYFAIYRLNNDQLINCLLRAASRRIKVNILMDGSSFDNKDNNYTNIKKLVVAGKWTIICNYYMYIYI